MNNLENPDATINVDASTLFFVMSTHAKVNTILDVLAEMKAASTGTPIDEVRQEFNERVAKNMENKTNKLVKFLD